MAIDPPPLRLDTAPDGVELLVKVVPGASRSAILGRWNDALRVAVAAPPERGKANRAVTELLSGALGAARGNVEVIAGHTSALKRVLVRGVALDDVRARLEVATDGA